MRVYKSVDYREGHEVFSALAGGTPLSFSRRISGGSRSSPGPKERLFEAVFGIIGIRQLPDER